MAAAWAVSPGLIDSAIPAPCLRYGVSSYAVASFARSYPVIIAMKSNKDTESQTRRGQVVELKGGGRNELYHRGGNK